MGQGQEGERHAGPRAIARPGGAARGKWRLGHPAATVGAAVSVQALPSTRSCQATRITTRLATAAPSRNPAGAPHSWATVAARKPPIGADPAKTVTYRDMTRPRSASGTLFWTITLIELTISIETRPRAPMIG